MLASDLGQKLKEASAAAVRYMSKSTLLSRNLLVPPAKERFVISLHAHTNTHHNKKRCHWRPFSALRLQMAGVQWVINSHFCCPEGLMCCCFSADKIQTPSSATIPQINNVKHRVVIVSFLRFGIRNIIVCPQVCFLRGNARTFTDSIFAAWLHRRSFIIPSYVKHTT